MVTSYPATAKSRTAATFALDYETVLANYFGPVMCDLTIDLLYWITHTIYSGNQF